MSVHKLWINPFHPHDKKWVFNQSVVFQAWGDWINSYMWHYFMLLTFDDQFTFRDGTTLSRPTTLEGASTSFHHWLDFFMRENFLTRVGYAFVPEFTTKGIPHLHVLLYIPETANHDQIKDTWGRGNTGIRQYNPALGATHYIGKTITEDDCRVVAGMLPDQPRLHKDSPATHTVRNFGGADQKSHRRKAPKSKYNQKSKNPFDDIKLYLVQQWLEATKGVTSFCIFQSGTSWLVHVEFDRKLYDTIGDFDTLVSGRKKVRDDPTEQGLLDEDCWFDYAGQPHVLVRAKDIDPSKIIIPSRKRVA